MYSGTKDTMGENTHFEMAITGKFFNVLSRQADEGDRIKHSAKHQSHMNSKAEFNSTQINRIGLVKVHDFTHRNLGRLVSAELLNSDVLPVASQSAH